MKGYIVEVFKTPLRTEHVMTPGLLPGRVNGRVLHERVSTRNTSFADAVAKATKPYLKRAAGGTYLIIATLDPTVRTDEVPSSAHGVMGMWIVDTAQPDPVPVDNIIVAGNLIPTSSVDLS